MSDIQRTVHEPAAERGWRGWLHTVIFEADTRGGRLFDLLLIACIIASVVAVMLDSVPSMRMKYGGWFQAAEWTFTLLFTIEYVLRLLALRSPMRYATSFYGVVDLLSFLPTYISFMLPGAQFLLVIRLLRVLRIFRVLKLVEYVGAGHMLADALKASRLKIYVFLFTVLVLVTLMGSLMYLIEGAENGFTSIPTGIYWAVVTMTTVGYGDLSPHTAAGKILASIIMITGYAIIAVPTGIVSAEMVKQVKGISTQACPRCGAEGHDPDARFCKYCGTAL